VEWSVKKGRLFERSEFEPFSGMQHNFSKIRAALTFWFFCVKAKEQTIASSKKKGTIKNKISPLPTKVVTG
jgi:hypothetical protein